MRYIVLSFTIFLTQTYAAFEVTFHRVGEGNCTTIAVDSDTGKNKKEYMIVDCGTNEYKKTLNTPTDVHTTSIPTSIHEAAPPSAKKQRTETKTSTEQGNEINKNKAIIGIREVLGGATASDSDSSIVVKTVVISHPDADHYNWIWDVCNPNKDKLENIVLGGRAEKYLNLKNVSFRSWLKGWLQQGTKVFFLAAKDSMVKNSEDLKRFEGGSYELGSSLFSNPLLESKKFNLVSTRVSNQDSLVKPSDDLYKAFDFGSNTLFEFLTINPLHVPSNIIKDQYIRLSYTEDESADIDNQDSLVMKIINTQTKKSVVLTGDATALTMTRVFSNYNPSELKTDVLLAAHHGSSSNGSNNRKIFDVLKPKCVVFSNGQHLKFAHPRERAYDNAKQVIGLGQIAKHNITRYNKTEESDKAGEYVTYETTRPIFSTFDNGSIQVAFPDKSGHMAIKGIEEGTEKLYPLQDSMITAPAQEELIVKKYTELTENTPIFVSPKKQASPSQHTVSMLFFEKKK